MQQVTQVFRPDPAPSRLKYRMERLMLTPLFRFALRVGLPFALGLGGASWYFSVEANRAAVMDALLGLQEQVQSRPEFAVSQMSIDGAGPGVTAAVREAMALQLPLSSFDLDLDALRARIGTLDAVKSVALRIRQGGVLQVDVVERVPVVLWRSGTGLEMLDDSGARVGPAASRTDRPDLPVIAGTGARDHVSEALALLTAAAPLEGRLRGLERIGERRWDVVLDRGQRILLPETDAVQALERAMAMDGAVDMLSRDIAAVDLRLAQRPTLRLSAMASQEYWRIKAMETGDQRQ
ncbi:cell division protein FtsQ/DivIB [Salipiger marinus]|jgi:cell division protein FtsQ|uniref:Cell division protein FtsQ n=1 Tax=Salipiger marinus TaxID=555512 RepID=A0A1G8MXK0_9RHOB|nr:MULTISPECIES: cell division protein FtsQ/DivIB [Salipiger]HBM57972.1 cell division protein FtsQ [Citreicella sp.]MCD1616515.1 cell division protein FtsQ/DivIB [Salipiger manganoxidans]MEB3418995.1 cell division protein FtsQ/DivIB [Salipiger manganoxidans]SDI72547.1 cell division protein FtsQ [Salipiger marinus]HBT01994.1 cell division protein FtsQ [Citreicella sp.]